MSKIVEVPLQTCQKRGFSKTQFLLGFSVSGFSKVSKFCLQKAAFKALSRRGWELIQPSEAFEPSRYYDYNYRNPLREDVYASKKFKVIKRTLAM